MQADLSDLCLACNFNQILGFNRQSFCYRMSWRQLTDPDRKEGTKEKTRKGMWQLKEQEGEQKKKRWERKEVCKSYISCGVKITHDTKNIPEEGRLGGSVGWASNFSSSHDLSVCEFEPHGWLCADSSGPGACFRFCVSLSLCPFPFCALFPFLSKINKPLKKEYSRTNFP